MALRSVAEHARGGGTTREICVYHSDTPWLLPCCIGIDEWRESSVIDMWATSVRRTSRVIHAVDWWERIATPRVSV